MLAKCFPKRIFNSEFTFWHSVYISAMTENSSNGSVHRCKTLTGDCEKINLHVEQVLSFVDKIPNGFLNVSTHFVSKLFNSLKIYTSNADVYRNFDTEQHQNRNNGR